MLKAHPLPAELQLLALPCSYTQRVEHEPAVETEHSVLTRHASCGSSAQVVEHVNFAGSQRQFEFESHAPCVEYEAAHLLPHFPDAASTAQLGLAEQTAGFVMAVHSRAQLDPSQLQFGEATQSAFDETREHVGWQKPLDHMQAESAEQSLGFE